MYIYDNTNVKTILSHFITDNRRFLWKKKVTKILFSRKKDVHLL